MAIIDEAEALQPDLVRLRRELHADPEVGLSIPRTQRRVLAALDGLPLEVTLGHGTTSIVAVLRGGAYPAGAQPAATVLLRGDMDALPIREDTGLPYASTNGAMHACGHDLHTAALVGAARLLCAHRDRLRGDVVLMFQPGEEGCDGAGVMIDEGALSASGHRPDHAYALHVTSADLVAGTWSGRPGTLMADSYSLDVTVHGAGGHGSAPHQGVDPVVVLAEIVTALQTMVTRRFDVHDPVVISVGVLRAGTARNVIPHSATLQGTARAYSVENSERLHELVPTVVSSIAAAHGAEAEVVFEAQYPATVNDSDEFEYGREVIEAVAGEESFRVLPHPVSGSEDFSRVLREVPGAYFFLGACPDAVDPEAAPGNHSARAQFDDAVLAQGAAVLASLALGRLADGDADRDAPGTDHVAIGAERR